jgi:hypothetical protein
MQKYKKEKIFGHMKVQEEKEKNRDTWRSQGIETNMSTWRLIKNMIAMSQNKKLERDHIYKRSIV